MDNSVALVAAAVVLILILILLNVLRKQFQPGELNNAAEAVQQEAPGAVRRAVAGRNNRGLRNRLANRQHDAGAGNVPGGGSNDEGSNYEDEAPASLLDLGDMKVGKKKLAKLEAKAEKKVAREAEEKEREERREREAEREKERQLIEAEEKQQELEKEEQIKKEALEREQREHEEYLAMKAAFTVEEQGFEAGDENVEENTLQRFIDYVKDTKIVLLEELAANFQLKTPDAIDRLQKLVQEGDLTGVIDDRGKFICISMEEMNAVAKFIRQRGRISLSDLAESSNQLIQLGSTEKA